MKRPKKEHVFFVRIRVEWPTEGDEEREAGSALSQLLEEQARLREDFQSSVDETLTRRLDQPFLVEEIYFGRGSLTIFAVIAASYAFVGQYKDLRDGAALLVNDLRNVVRSILEEMGVKVGMVEADIVPGRAMVRSGLESARDDELEDKAEIVNGENTAVRGAVQGSGRGSMFWFLLYLVASNILLIAFLGLLLVWSVVLAQG